jgi:hypothetical protein
MSLETEVAYLHLFDGARQSEVPPGLSVHSAPRKAARGRDRDVLMIGLHLGPGAPRELVDSVVTAYFGTPGSVTAAARAAFVAARARLTDFNRYPPASGPVQGGLCLAVLRGSDLYAGLAGVGQVLIVHPNAVERFPDPSADPMPPFGGDKSADVQYFHTVVAPADFAVLTGSLPSGWETGTLTHLAGGTLESAVARLTRSAGTQAAAMIVRFAAEEVPPKKTHPAITAAPLNPPATIPTPGAEVQPAPGASVPSTPGPDIPPPETGLPASHRPHPPTQVPLEAGQVSGTPAVQPIPAAAEQASNVPAARPELKTEASGLAGIIARVRASTAMGEPDDIETAPGREPAVSHAGPGEDTVVQIGDHVYEFEETDEAAPAAQTSPHFDARDAMRHFVARLPFNRAGEVVKQGSDSLGSTLSESSGAILRRVLPEGTIRPDASLRIPERLFMVIAILLPIMIAVGFGVVYIQRGRNERFRLYLEGARTEAGLARVQPDPLSAKPHWQNALTELELADQIFPNQPDAAALRREAQAAVDAVDNVQRLEFAPLVPGGFGGSARIVEVVLHGNEVYALDATRQAVYRAILTADDKYVIDRNFQCQLGVVGTVVIGRMVDIAWLNTPNIVGQPALMALDEDGDLMYCKTDGTPPEASTLIAPDTGWKRPTAVELYADRLYVFDPGANDIFLYDRVGGVFSERPKSYFTGQVLDLSAAVNYTIAQGEVFLLRGDGRLTYCVRDLTTSQTRCVENALFTDSRPSHASGDRLDDVALPLSLFFDPPPEPSLYLLDTGTNGIYQLSLKLVLQKVYRSTRALNAPITTVAIGPNKEMFVGSGNNVYWARR